MSEPRSQSTTGKQLSLERKTYSIPEAAILLGVGRTTAYALAARDELPVPTLRVGRSLLVSKPALDRVLGVDYDHISLEGNNKGRSAFGHRGHDA